MLPLLLMAICVQTYSVRTETICFENELKALQNKAANDYQQCKTEKTAMSAIEYSQMLSLIFTVLDFCVSGIIAVIMT
jgi:hypothetical protein